MKERDIILTEGEPGKLVAHRPDCPVVQEHRERGRAILSLYGIEGPWPKDLPRHDCLERKK